MITHTKDHEIVIGSTTRRLNLLRDSQGKAMYSVNEDVPDHLTPVLFQQNDWSNGFNQYNFTDPKAYLYGQNIDTSYGQIILGPDDTSIQPYYFPTYAFACDGGVFTDESTAAGNSTINDMTLLPATPAENDAYYFGSSTKFKTLTIDVYSSGEGIGTWTVVWEIWNGSSWSATDTTVVSGENLKNDMNVTISPSATWAATTVNSQSAYWLRARVSSYTSVVTAPKGRWAHIQEMTPTAVTLFLTDFVHYGIYYSAFFASGFYTKGGVNTYALFYGNYASLTQYWTSTVEITDLEWFANTLYIGQGASNKYYYFDTTTLDFTQSNLVDGYANKFLIAPNPDGSNSLLWKSKNYNEICSSSDGKNTTGSWTSPVYIGDTSESIQMLAVAPSGKMIIGKSDGSLYQYNSDGTINILLGQSGNTMGFTPSAAGSHSNPIYFKGSLYFIRENTLLEMTSYNTLNEVGPLDKLTEAIATANNTSVYSSLTASNTHLYVLCLVNGVTVIFKGTPKADGFAWCPNIYNASPSRGIHMTEGGDYGSYVFWACGAYLYYAYCSNNPLDDSNARFNTDGGLIRMSYTYGTDPYWDKLIQSIVTETSGCSATVTVTPKYWKNTDSSATNLTAAITTNGVVNTQLTTALTGNRFQFELDLATGANTTTPIIRHFQVLGAEKPTTYRVHECVYDVGSDPNVKASTIRSFLRGGRTSTSLIKFADLRYGESTSGTAGTNYEYVIMEPGFPQEIETYNEKSRMVEQGIKVRFREVNYP